MVSVQAKLFTYGVDGVEGERTVLQREDVPLAVMGRPRLCADIHGRPRIFIGKGCDETFLLLWLLVVSLVNFDEY